MCCLPATRFLLARQHAQSWQNYMKEESQNHRTRAGSQCAQQASGLLEAALPSTPVLVQEPYTSALTQHARKTAAADNACRCKHHDRVKNWLCMQLSGHQACLRQTQHTSRSNLDSHCPVCRPAITTQQAAYPMLIAPLRASATSTHKLFVSAASSVRTLITLCYGTTLP
jgi:hypothetical protein